VFTVFHKRAFKSQYVKNFTALAGSEVIAQLIIIGVMPFLTRIYTPVEFGQYEFFKTTSLLLVVVGFLNYDVSVYTAKNSSERINSILFTALVLTCICLASSVLLFLFNDIFVKYSGSEIKEGWFWTLPIYAFFSALTNLMMIVFTKSGSFKLLAGLKILVSIMVALTQLFFGWLGMGYWGLVYSTIIVQFIAFVIYFIPFFNEFKNCAKECSLAEMRKIVLTNWRLPVIVFPGNFLNNLAQSLPVFFLGKMDSQILGYYGLARRVIEFPLKFVASAVQRLYVKELTDEIKNTGTGKLAYIKNLKLYGVFAVLLILGILSLTKPLLPILFGKEWEPAVPYVMILAVLFSVKFVFGGLSFVMVIGKAPKIDIVWQICFALVVAITFIICINFQIELINTMIAFVVVGIFSYVCYGMLSYHVARSNNLLSV